ncbi:MAG: monovalent cation/H(+) antiporter subunit G [Alphaproteobacteria bacterium]
MVIDIFTWILLVGGSFFVVSGGIGLLRMPDFFTRLHAAGVTDTMGAGLILLGLMLQGGASFVTVKLVLILVFLLFTSPTASHALAHAALVGGHKPWTKRSKTP